MNSQQKSKSEEVVKTLKRKNRRAIKKKKARDYSKYVFQGKPYGKGPLVLAVVQDYVKKHPRVTSNQLKELFPKKDLHSGFDVVTPINRAAKGRFFLQKDDVIVTADKKRLAVTNQWNKINIVSFIDYAKKELKMPIKQVA